MTDPYESLTTKQQPLAQFTEAFIKLEDKKERSDTTEQFVYSHILDPQELYTEIYTCETNGEQIDVVHYGTLLEAAQEQLLQILEKNNYMLRLHGAQDVYE